MSLRLGELHDCPMPSIIYIAWDNLLIFLLIDVGLFKKSINN